MNTVSINKSVTENVPGYSDNGNNITWSFSPWITERPFVNRGLEPEKIIYNERTTIVYWNDNSRSISTCSENEIFDEEIGFAVCLLKKMFGKKVYGKKLYRRMIANAQKYRQSYKPEELPF